MLESGMSVDVIEHYIDKMPYANPLRTHFATQLIATLPVEEGEAMRLRLVKDVIQPTVKLGIHTSKRDFTFLISSFLDEKTVDQFVKRVVKSEDNSGDNKPPKDN